MHILIVGRGYECVVGRVRSEGVVLLDLMSFLPRDGLCVVQTLIGDFVFDESCLWSWYPAISRRVREHVVSTTCLL